MECPDSAGSDRSVLVGSSPRERLSGRAWSWAPGGVGPGARPQRLKLSTVEDAEVAFRRIYDAHYGEVLAYCRRRTQPADAHDAASEVFTVVWKRIDDRPDDEKLKAWLFGIAFRVLGHQWRGRDRYQRLKGRLAGASRPVEPGADEHVERNAEHELVLEAARSLRLSDQEILRLAGWEELPHSDIAEMLGTSVAAVDQRFHRAKKRLARVYDDLSTKHQPTRRGAGGMQ
jgi:RNA polymerase sigma factor (sigma-70 family)